MYVRVYGKAVRSQLVNGLLILIGAMYVDVKRKKRSESYLKRMFKGSKARAPAPPERVVEPSIYGSGEKKNRGGIRTI